MWLVICLVIAVSFDNARSSLAPLSDANVRLYLTKRGLDYAKSIMMNKTKTNLEDQKVPPVRITKSMFWNTIRLSLFNSKMKSVSMGPTSIHFENGFIKLSLVLNSAAVAGEYNYQGGIFGSGTGKYMVKLENVWITKYLSIETNATGKPFLVNGACSNWIQDTSTVFTGGSSFIINLLVALVKSSVNNDVRKKICSSISEAIEKKGKMLPKLYPESYDISRVQCAQLNFPILQKPLIQANYIDFLMEGGINSSCYPLNNSPSGQGVSHIRYVPHPSKMITIVFSDRFINSLLDLFHGAGVMKFDEIQSNDLLTPLRVALRMTSPPLINTTANSSVATFKMEANCTAASSLHKITEPFFVDLEVQSDFHIEEEDRNISGIVKNLRFKPFFTDKIPEKIQALVLPALKSRNVEIINQINGLLHKMAPLPMIPQIEFTNKQFLPKEGFTVFESDVRTY